MNAFVENYVAEIVESLKPIEPDRVILFGSAAYDTMHMDSDIDLVVVLDEERIPSSYEEKLSMRVRVKTEMKDINDRIALDVVVYTTAEYRELMKNKGSFLTELTTTGITIYEKKSMMMND